MRYKRAWHLSIDLFSPFMTTKLQDSIIVHFTVVDYDNYLHFMNFHHYCLYEFTQKRIILAAVEMNEGESAQELRSYTFLANRKDITKCT